MDETEEVTTVSREQPSTVRTTRSSSHPRIHTDPPQKAYETKKTIFRTYQIIWYILGFIEALLTLRILFKILGANSASPFVSLIYGITDPLALPFAGIFRTMVTPTGSYFEWSTVLAMIIYLLIAYGIVNLIQLLKPTTPREVDEKVESV